MLEEYISMFKDEVLYEHEVEMDNIPKLLWKNQDKIVYVDNVMGYKIIGNLWARRDRFKAVLGNNLLENMLRAIDNPQPYMVVDNDMKSEKVDFEGIPIPKYYPKEGGRYITSGVVFSEYNNKRNASFHRIMLRDSNTGVIRLVPRDLYRMHIDAKEHGEEVNIAVAIGLEPHVLLSAATSVAYEVDELEIASALRNFSMGSEEKAIRLPNGVNVPRNSEIVLEGKITNDYDYEGPFVDITRTYDTVRKQPVIEFTRLYFRTKTLHLLISGGKEHYNLMGMPREPTIFREIKRDGVDVIDVRLTHGGCSWLHAVVKIKKHREDDGRKAIYGAFRGHRSLKHVVVVDEDINIDDPNDVEFAIATRFQGDRDLIKMGPTRGSSLDPSAYEGHMTVKLGLDATMPLENRSMFTRIKNI